MKAPTPCQTCLNEKDSSCLHCVNGSKYEGPDADITYSVGVYPVVTMRRHVTFKKDNQQSIKGSEDSKF